MYKKVSIENSRGIKNFSLDDFQQVNLIYGKNNTCKTTILEALYTLGSPSRSDNALRVNSNRCVKIVNAEIWKSFFYKNDISKPIRFFTELKTKEKREVEITIRRFSELKDAFEGLNIRAIQLKDGEKTPRIINTGTTTATGSLDYITSREYIPDIPKIWINTSSGLEDILNEVHINLSTLIVKKLLDNIIRALKNIEPNLVQIHLIPEDLIYVDVGVENLYPVSYLGTGFVRALHIISALFMSINGVLFIDGIEAGLSSNVVDMLYTIILRLAKDLNVQVFITTNTSDSLKGFVTNCVKNMPNTTDEIRLYKLERYRKDDSLKATVYDRKRIESALSEPRR